MELGWSFYLFVLRGSVYPCTRDCAYSSGTPDVLLKGWWGAVLCVTMVAQVSGFEHDCFFSFFFPVFRATYYGTTLKNNWLLRLRHSCAFLADEIELLKRNHSSNEETIRYSVDRLNGIIRNSNPIKCNLLSRIFDTMTPCKTYFVYTLHR